MNSASINKLKEIVGENNVLDNPADLYVYGSDSSVHEARPNVVVILTDHAEVTYQVSAAYTPGVERGLRWNDPALALLHHMPSLVRQMPLLSRRKVNFIPLRIGERV